MLNQGSILFLALLVAMSSNPGSARTTPGHGAVAPQLAAAKSPAGVPAELKWPQTFELSAGERAAFGFYAGQPGRILVTVQVQGIPLLVSLVKPGGGTVDKTGSGTVTLDYAATAEDVKKGVIWSLRLRSAQELKPNATLGTAVNDRPVKIDLRSVAKGSVTIQHPPADLPRTQAEFNLQLQKANAQQASMRPQVNAQQQLAAAANLVAQRKLIVIKGVAARQAAQLEQIKMKIPAEAHQQLSTQIALLAQGKTVLSAPLVTGAKGTLVPINPGTGTSGPAGAVKTPRTTQPVVVATPSISALSVTRGDPGTPVLISGSGLSDSAGEVHFIVANGTDLVAPLTTWTETQILTQVPYKDGVPAYNGYVYVKRSDGAKTTLQPFVFYPPLDVAVLGFPIASTSGTYNQTDHLYDSHAPDLDWGCIGHNTFCAPWGMKGDDEYYLQTRLKNGWNLDSAGIAYRGHPGPDISGSAGAYITDARIGTDSPYVKVHWWVDANSGVYYNTLLVTIRGPKGLPYK